MVLSEATWLDVQAFSREAVVLIPTGAVEQHGPHLPLITDALIVEEIAQTAEKGLPDKTLLVPTVWLGMSAAHITFSGTLDAGFDAYPASLSSLIVSLLRHGFRRFLVLNGHGGNSDANRLVLRRAKDQNPNGLFAHVSYFDLIPEAIADAMQGPSKHMSHADESETSLMLFLKPELVKLERARKDGMRAEPEIAGLVQNFDEMSEEGAIGYPTFATPEAGRKIFDAAVAAVQLQISNLAGTLVMRELGE